MTRGIRFTPFLRAGLFAAVTLPAGPARGADVPLVRQAPIAEDTHVSAASVVDMDGDGDADVVSTNVDALYWYENTGGSWSQRTIQTVPPSVLSAATADLDSDGDVDVLSTGAPSNIVFWHENTAGNGSAWAAHTLATATNAREVETGDVDGDGDLDVLVGSLNRVAWLENTGNPSAWPLRTIMSAATFPSSIVPVDLDRDGDLDVVASDSASSSVLLFWAENTAGNGTSWTVRSVATGSNGGAHVAAADINGDGDVDLVVGYSASHLRWFENAAGTGTAWTAQTIAGIPGNGRVSTGDLDGDGDQDVLAGFAGTADDHTFWFENAAGDGSAWTRHTVAKSDEASPSVFVSADLDRDGDHDFLLGTGGSDRLVWFRNDSIHRRACFAPAAAVYTSTSASPGPLSLADVDGDGALDVVSYVLDITGPILWHENAADDGSAWLTHTLATGVNDSRALASADVDRDGDTDVLSAAQSGNQIAWHENLGGGSSWASHTVGSFTRPVALSVADFDGDGDVDALAAGDDNTSLRWFANDGSGLGWTLTTLCQVIASCFGSGLAVGDVDRDGDLDAASSPTVFESRVRWHENVAGSTWTPHTVGTSLPLPSHGLAAGDLEGDGDLDLMGAFHYTPDTGLRWFANDDGIGGAWSRQTVSLSPAHRVTLGDLDRDGDLDAAATGNGPEAVTWHENEGGAVAWTAHTLATSIASGFGVAAGDVDRDGDLDLVASRRNDRRIDWFANRSGQFSLQAVDIAPPGAPNGALVAMLRAVATHLGRAGDGSLELATLGIKFEQAAGNPLTNAEANALIESLRIYQDSNGSGVFEPGADVQVLTVPTLALVGGVLLVPLDDGDPGVQVGFGTPRTYFVVTELTANASTQSPNLFRVRLLGLGPWASTAEDRTYDIALEPACPADVASSVMGAIPVTLMRFSVE
jgi:hypothetical protein